MIHDGVKWLCYYNHQITTIIVYHTNNFIKKFHGDILLDVCLLFGYKLDTMEYRADSLIYVLRYLCQKNRICRLWCRFIMNKGM